MVWYADAELLIIMKKKLRMRLLVFHKFVLSRERLVAIMEGTVMFLSRMFGAFAMALEVTFPLRFVAAFTAITCGTIGAELGV